MDKISLRKYNKIMIVILLVIIAVEILCLAYHINWDFLAWIFWIVLAFDIGVMARPYLIKEDDE